MAGNVPTGVKVISVLYYISAVIGILVGLLLFVAAGAIGTLVENNPLFSVLGSAAFAIMGVIIIVLGVLCIFVGRGLWKGQKWARIVAIILAVLGILMQIFSIIAGSYVSGIIFIIIHAAIGGYLLFSKDVKQAFG